MRATRRKLYEEYLKDNRDAGPYCKATLLVGLAVADALDGIADRVSELARAVRIEDEDEDGDRTDDRIDEIGKDPLFEGLALGDLISIEYRCGPAGRTRTAIGWLLAVDQEGIAFARRVDSEEGMTWDDAQVISRHAIVSIEKHIGAAR